MRKMFRYLRWFVVGAGLLTLMLALAVGVYTKTEHFRRLVRDQLVATFNSSIRGSVSLDRIQGSIWGSVTFYDVRLRYQESDILRIPQLKLAYALLPLIRGQLRIARAEAARPSVQLVRDPQGRWNIAEALSSDGETASRFTVVLSLLAVREGSLDIQLGGTEIKSYRLRNFAMRSRLAVLPTGVEFAAPEASASLRSEGLPDLNLKGGVIYHDAGVTPTLKVDDFRIETASSRLTLAGSLTDFDIVRIRAKLIVDKLAPVDLARLVSGWPVKTDLNGNMAAEGAFDSLAVAADLATAGTKVRSRFNVNLSAAPPRYRGTAQIAGFDLHSVLADKQIAGIVDGSAEIQGAGFGIEQINATGTFAVRSAQLRDWALGDLRLSAELRERRVALNGDLNSRLGSAAWRGHLTFAAVPSYDFDLTVKDLDIERVSAAGKYLDGVLSFNGKVKGLGVTLADLNAQATVQVLPSRIGPVQVRKGEVVAVVAERRLRVARATLSDAQSTLTVKGDLGLDLNQRGKLDYEFRTENLSPWLSLVERKGSGSLSLAGSVQGNLDELTTRGSMKLSRLKIAALAVDNGEIDFALTRKNDPFFPDGRVTLRLVKITAGVPLRDLNIAAHLSSYPSRAAQIEVRAQDQFGRFHRVKAAVHYSSAELVANLSQLILDLPDGTWSLAQPCIVGKRGDALQIENFALRNGERRALVNGFVALSGPQGLTLIIENFSLDAVAAFLPKQPKMTGLVALQGRLEGTANAPYITAAVKLTDSAIGGQSYAGAVGNLSYRQGQADLNFTLRQDATHSLSATGKLPVQLSWHDGWRSQVTGELDLRVKSAGLSLAFLNVYTAKTISNVDGELSLDLSARGMLAEPNLSGTFRVAGGKLKATRLNVAIEEIAVEGAFDGRALKFKSFSARAGEGRLNGTGSLALKNYQLENFILAVGARRWPAINTRRYQAEIGGNLEVKGPLAAPAITGQAVITEANIRPDLAFLERSSTSVKRDETIVVLRRSGTESGKAAADQQSEGYGDSELFKKLSADVSVSIPRNVWVRHPDAAAELSAELRATKKSGQSLQLEGTGEIIRGWAAFQGRRFSFERGEIRFVGGSKIDPVLDIVARHRLPRYTVDAVVGGTAANPTLALRSNPGLDQADILALLLFGKPTRDLNRSEQDSLRQNAIDVTSGFAATRVGAAVAETLGLDDLGLGEIEFSGGRVGVGRYVGSETYVTVNQDLAGEKGQEARVEYQLAPDWKIGTSTTSEGSRGVELIWQKRY